MATKIEAVAINDAALSVRGLTVDLPKSMERAHAVENVSFELKRGQILCIIGESRSGKSVTATTIMGLLPKIIPVTSGAINLGGTTIVGAKKSRQLRGRVVSMIFQNPLSALNPLMTVGEQVTEVMAAHGVGTKAARRDRALELLCPTRNSCISSTPSGFRVVSASDIQRRKDMSVMFITHDFGVVAEITDSVVVMEKRADRRTGRRRPSSQIPQPPLHAAPHRCRSAPHRRRQKAQGAEKRRSVNGLCKTYRSGSALFGSQRVVPASAAVAQLGQYAERRAAISGDRTVAGDHPRGGHNDRSNQLQLHRRRVA